MVSMAPAPMLPHRQQSRSSGYATGTGNSSSSSPSCSTPTTISPSSNSPPLSFHDSSSPKSTLKSLLLTSFTFRDSFAAITNSGSSGNSNNGSPMSRPTRSIRSHSVSHAGVTHTVPALGQGATIVRTPADATSCMAQPSANPNGAWPYRQHSLRDPPTRPPRRPSATPAPAPGPSPAGYNHTDRSPRTRAPTLPDIDTASFQPIPSFNDVGAGHAGHARKMSVDPRDPRDPRARDPRERDRQADLDAEYLRRQASRTSNATITPRRDVPKMASPSAWNDRTTQNDSQVGTPTHHQPTSYAVPRYAPQSSQMQRSQSHNGGSRTLHTSHSNPHIHQPFVHPASDRDPRGDPRDPRDPRDSRDPRDPRDWQRMPANGAGSHGPHGSNGSHGSTGSAGSTGSSSHKPLGPSHHPATHPVALPPGRPLVRSATVPTKPSSHVVQRSTAQEVNDLRAPEREHPTWNDLTPQRRPSAPARTGGHGPSASVASVASVYNASAASPSPFAAILISHTSRMAPVPSTVLVTLRFGYSLDAEPNTHEVTVTLDTLRPAGGQLVTFVEQVLRPNSLQSSEGGCTPPLSVEGPEMTDGSSAEDSDFEYDDTRFLPMLQVPATSRQERREDEEETLIMTSEEYLVAEGHASPSSSPSPKHSLANGTPSRQPSSPALSRQPSNASISRQPSTSSLSRQPSNPSISRQPSRRGLGPPPSAYPTSLGGFGTPLPPLSALPAALAQARAEREAAAAAANGGCTPPLVIRRPRSNTCPGPAVATITELTILLQRDASAWHIIASRLCSGSWPEMAGRRRRVEDECRWAGMDALLAELSQMPTLSRRGGFV